MATGLLARWLQTKKIFFMFTLGGGGGYSLSKIFLYTRWRYNLSEIPVPYQIDLKEIATTSQITSTNDRLFS